MKREAAKRRRRSPTSIGQRVNTSSRRRSSSHGTHVLDADDPPELQEEEPEEGDEGDALDILFEDEGEEQEDDEGMMEEEDGDEHDEEELKEIFASGWKAKQKTAEFRKNQGWKPNGGGEKASGKGTHIVDF